MPGMPFRLKVGTAGAANAAPAPPVAKAAAPSSAARRPVTKVPSGRAPPGTSVRALTTIAASIVRSHEGETNAKLINLVHRRFTGIMPQL